MGKNLERGEYVNPEGSAFWEYLAAMGCSSLTFCVGSILGWSSPGMAILMGPDTPMAFSNTDATILVAMGGLGFGLAPMLTPLMADKLGRKNSFLVVSIPLIVSWGLVAVAKDVLNLFIARFLAGITAGLILCLAPIYLGEIASVKLRGALGIVIGTTINAGLLFIYVVVSYTSLSTSAYICLTITTGSMISLWFIPESPYFLTIVGKVNEAEGALEKLRGKTDVGEEMDLIKRTISHDEGRAGDAQDKKNVLKQLITVPGNRKSSSIIFLFVFVLQFGSYVTSMVYGPIVFKAMRTGVPVNICTCIIAALQLIFNILTSFVVDRLGRRPLICVSGIVSGACVLVVGIYFYLMEYTEMDVIPYSVFPLGAMFLNIIAISFGLMPMQMVLQSEILATEIKSLASALVGMAGGVMTIASTVMYLKFVNQWNTGQAIPFFGFCVVTWTSTALIMMMLPETKGKNFLEIQKALNA